MNQTEKKQLAEKIAARVLDEVHAADQADVSALSVLLKDMQAKLEKIEEQLAGRSQTAEIIHPKQFQITNHSSQERFAISEAVSDELNQFFQKEKACTFEPNAKPCDHCAMCSSRGF
jgi:hypothetical protein